MQPVKIALSPPPTLEYFAPREYTGASFFFSSPYPRHSHAMGVFFSAYPHSRRKSP